MHSSKFDFDVITGPSVADDRKQPTPQSPAQMPPASQTQTSAPAPQRSR
jgi:hypothetical protein